MAHQKVLNPSEALQVGRRQSHPLTSHQIVRISQSLGLPSDAGRTAEQKGSLCSGDNGDNYGLFHHFGRPLPFLIDLPQ